MDAVVVDTQAAVWYFLKSPKLSANALAAIENAVRGGGPVSVSIATPAAKDSGFPLALIVISAMSAILGTESVS